MSGVLVTAATSLAVLSLVAALVAIGVYLIVHIEETRLPKWAVLVYTSVAAIGVWWAVICLFLNLFTSEGR